MRTTLWLLPMLMLLAACVDFVDPVGLGLARDTRMDLSLDVTDNALLASCPGPGLASTDSAVLCVQATVVPGINRLGERLRVLDDTLRMLGVAITPSLSSDSLLLYQHRFAFSRAALAETPLTASFPRVEGVTVPVREVRWFALGRVDPDTLIRAPGAGVQFQVRQPGGVSDPRPNFEFWGVDVAGNAETAAYNAAGVPRAQYAFPAEVLATLGGPRLVGELRWFRSYSSFGERLQLMVRFSQRMRWTILTRQ